MEDEYRIPFVQYMRPNGRRVEGDSCPVNINLAPKVQDIRDNGWVFECEVLTTGQVSLTVSDGEEDVGIELSVNGPSVADAIERLVNSVWGKLKGVVT